MYSKARVCVCVGVRACWEVVYAWTCASGGGGGVLLKKICCTDSRCKYDVGPRISKGNISWWFFVLFQSLSERKISRFIS